MANPTRAELRYLVWQNRGIRAARDTPIEELHGLLRFDPGVTPRENPINAMRETIIRFVADNPDKLSLYCDGNCFAHDDAIVLWCHKQFIEQT